MSPTGSRRPATAPAAALALVTASLVVALPGIAAAAPLTTTFPVPVAGDGTPVEVAAAHGTVAWLTVDAGTTALHVDRGGATTTVPVTTSPTTLLDRLSVGTTASGRPVVLAVRRTALAAPTGPDGPRTGQDVVRIDPATGSVTPVAAAAQPNVEETAAAIEHGTVVVSLRSRKGKARPVLYRTTLTGTGLTFLRSISDLPAQPAGFRSVDVDELAIAPGSTSRTGLTVAVRTRGDAEFGSQAIFTLRRSGTPRLVASWSDGGAGTSRSIGGLSWQTASRLWYADVDERGASATPPFASRVVRYSIVTHRQAEVRAPVTVADLAWVDAARVTVGVVRDSTAAGVPARLGATGPVTLSPYTPRR